MTPEAGDNSPKSDGAFLTAVETAMETLQHGLEAVDVARSSYQARIASRRETWIRAELSPKRTESAGVSILFLAGGGLFLYVDGAPHDVGEDRWRSEDGTALVEVIDTIRRIAVFGIVWVGWPLRGRRHMLTPRIPSTVDEMERLLRGRHHRYQVPWAS